MCGIESHFCERGQCLTVGNQRAQCNSRLISAILPKSCCDTNSHPPGQTLLPLEESLKKCLVEQSGLLLSQENTHWLLLWNCKLPFESSLCKFSCAHVKNSKNLSSFHTTIHGKLVTQKQTVTSWTNSLSLKERLQIPSLSSPSSHVSTTQLCSFNQELQCSQSRREQAHSMRSHLSISFLT